MSKSTNAKIIDVAVAVIYYQNQYLLGYRNASQHQGNRYEFVGGKIEADENPKQGLIREVVEEIGCDLSENMIIKMGVIRHDYYDNEKLEKSVALHIFKIEVNKVQFDSLQGEQGSEGQAITWVDKADLLANKYKLPDANARILDWLTLPDTIYISHAIDKFWINQEWSDYYSEILPPNAYFYIRPQANNDRAIQLIYELISRRNDIIPLLQFQTFLASDANLEKAIVHLNHQQLMNLDFKSLPKNLSYFASCHDKNSLSKINELAKMHSVKGCFLSPVLQTPTHPESEGMGWQAFSKLATLSDVPVFALGGVSMSDLQTAWLSNAYGVAGIRLIEWQKCNL